MRAMPRQAAAIGRQPLILTEHDVGEVADLYARCADYFLLQDGEPPTLVDASELFRDVPKGKRADGQTVLGWRGTDGLSALAAVLPDYPIDGVWYLGFMIVDAAARGQGIGRLIHGIVEQWAVDRGAQELRLAVLEENRAAERFWRSLGYEKRRRIGPDAFKSRSHHRIELSRLLFEKATTAAGR